MTIKHIYSAPPHNSYHLSQGGSYCFLVVPVIIYGHFITEML